MRHYILLIILLATVSLQFCTKPSANEEVIDFKYDSIQTAKWNQICLSTISKEPVGCAYEKTDEGECLYCLVNEENKEVGLFEANKEGTAPFKLSIYKLIIRGKYWQTDTIFQVPDRVFPNYDLLGQIYNYEYKINDTVGVVRLQNKSYLYFGYSFIERYDYITTDNYFSNLLDLGKGKFSESTYRIVDKYGLYPKDRFGKIIAHDSLIKNRVKYNYMVSRIPGLRDSTSETEEIKAYLSLRKTNRDLTEGYIGENGYGYAGPLKLAYFKRKTPSQLECWQVVKTDKFIIYNLESGVILGYDRTKELYFPIVVAHFFTISNEPISISIENNNLLVPFRSSTIDLLSLDLSTFKYRFMEEKENLPDYHDNYQSQQDGYSGHAAPAAH
jgi:hypothetical protein